MFSTNSDHYSFLKPQDLHPPISFFHFPSPFEFDEFDDLFLQTHNFTSNNSSENSANPTPEKSTTMQAITKSSDQKKKIPRKRLSKKDRHSKITTARGLRDRRMRLSLPVARQFFGLQDMLGVDKGSKTVEWLLIQARPEILKLAKDRNFCLDRPKTSVSSSNSSEGDMVSGIEDENGNNNKLVQKKMKSLKDQKKKIRRTKQPRKTMAKELREKARARARARTMEKNQIRDSNFTKIITSSSWSSPFETTGEESGATHSCNNTLNLEVEKSIMSNQFETSQQPIIDYQNYSSLEIMGNWSPSHSTFNYLQQIGTLDLQQQNEFYDSQFFGLVSGQACYNPTTTWGFVS